MRVNNSNYIKQLKSGKEAALEFIVDKYLPLVKGIVNKVLLPTGDSYFIEECINDVFLSVWDNSSKFSGEDTDFRRWICVIAKFKAIDYYRKSKKNMNIAVEVIEELQVNSAEEEFLTKEEENQLIKLINQLEQIDRNIFVMKFFLGESSEDIAKKLNMSKAAIDNRIYRGKKKLRDNKSKARMEVI